MINFLDPATGWNDGDIHCKKQPQTRSIKLAVNLVKTKKLD